MPTGPLVVDLWNGKEVVGQVRHSPFAGVIAGKAVNYTLSPGPLKEAYAKRYESIELPIDYRCIKDDGVEYTIRRCFNVQRKSKRQVGLLLQYFGA